MPSINMKQCISINQDWCICIWWSLVTLSLDWKEQLPLKLGGSFSFGTKHRKNETYHATTGVYHISALSKCFHKITKGRRKTEGFSRQSFLLIAVSAYESWISWVNEGGNNPVGNHPSSEQSLWVTRESIRHTSPVIPTEVQTKVPPTFKNPTVSWQQAGASAW